MFDNLVVFENRYNEINEKLYDPDIVSDQKLYADLMKELKNITPIVEKYKEYQKASTAEAEAKEMLDAGGLDKDFREMVEQELRRMGVTDILHMQIPYGHAHIDGLLNMASHDVAMIHASQVPYDVCDALKKKGIKLLECPSRIEAKESFAINFVAIEPGTIAMPAGNPRSQELLEKNGIKVIPVEFDEIMKGFGAIHCCTAFLKRG